MAPIMGRINIGMEDEMVVIGYRLSKLKFVLLILSVFLSGGIMLIFLSWKNIIQLKLSHTLCPLSLADKVLLTDEDDQEFVEKVKLLYVRYNDKQKFKKYFINKKIKYVWSNRLNQFIKVSGSNDMKTFSSFHDNAKGLAMVVADARLQFYGLNSIAIEVKSILYLLWNEAINPFYIFQLFALALWIFQQYFYFTACVFLLSATSIGVTVWETRKQSLVLKETVSSYSMVTVLRDNKEIDESSHKLVPGDVIFLSTPNAVMECDAVLIQGQCIMNESALTGESVPVTKISLPQTNHDILNINEHKRHILFCGTHLLQSRAVKDEKVKAIVIRTGFNTMKGELVRSILYPKPVEFKFYTDFLKFFAIFIFLGLIAVLYSAIVWTLREATNFEIIVFTLDIFTFVVPPILPAAYTSITTISQQRLKKCDIYCLSSKYINMCASLDIICFDKTGTLTEDCLSLKAVIPVNNEAKFSEPVYKLLQLSNSSFLYTMATCHNLSVINGEILGNPLDKIIFESIDWVLEEDINYDVKEDLCTPIVVHSSLHHIDSTTNEMIKLIILKQYPFESNFQRTTVIARTDNSFNYSIFSKGAPEKIASLCLPSTVPSSFNSVLNSYTKDGNRVIACAWKSFPKSFGWDTIKDMQRNEIEYDLEFLGLIILQNFLKPETANVLQKLNSASVRSVMVTGDNLSTAINVARQCEMISDDDKVVLVNAILKMEVEISLFVNFENADASFDKNCVSTTSDQDNCVKLLTKQKHHFVLEGATFNLLRLYNRELLQKVVEQGAVFARMLPEQKVHLVTCLQDLGYQVGMCGDGANDCGALKCAHAGVSLSVAEASVAAPFTSKKQNISCVLSLISEGRASLISCMGIFKYEVSYCFSLLFVALILYYVGLRPSDTQYLYWDLVLSIIPAMLFGNVNAFPHVVKTKPVKKLLGIVPLFSMFTFLLLHLVMYIICWEFVKAQPWFEEFKYKTGVTKLYPTYESTTLFTACAFSILTAVVNFSEGPPFRQPFYTNKMLTTFLIVTFIFSSYLAIYPADWLQSFLKLKTAPEFEFHIILFAIVIAHCLLSYLLEEYFVKIFVAQIIAPFLRMKFGSRTYYEQIKQELESDKSWPPIGQTLKQNVPRIINVINAADYNPNRNRSKSTVSAISAVSV